MRSSPLPPEEETKADENGIESAAIEQSGLSMILPQETPPPIDHTLFVPKH